VSQQAEQHVDMGEHGQAFTEVSFLLEMLVRTAGVVVGKSTPSLGTNAGRHMGRKLPVLLREPNLGTALAAVGESLGAGFDLTAKVEGNAAAVTIGRCVLRDVCKERGLALDGEICKMFHYYLAGMTAQLLGKAVRPSAAQAGETCTLKLDA
jgi:hypothetical protein